MSQEDGWSDRFAVWLAGGWAQVVAFEPMPSNEQVLRHNLCLHDPGQQRVVLFTKVRASGHRVTGGHKGGRDTGPALRDTINNGTCWLQAARVPLTPACLLLRAWALAPACAACTLTR